MNHFIRWISNTPLDIVEITGAQMVLVMKLGLFAWAAYDGGRPMEKLDSAQVKERLVQVPDLLSFLGYWWAGTRCKPDHLLINFRTTASTSLRL